ncbi:uncharacterized protein LOC124819201 [Hydra vulgaris]|uniref:uncharacterized protein LOC124819201 n=1 Tax=Hydra vulgaris TaxID=6087 RepID=UPI001F5F7F44|nr:uncharacterized protein LOC124819201 [Hydra vulgaris]
MSMKDLWALVVTSSKDKIGKIRETEIVVSFHWISSDEKWLFWPLFRKDEKYTKAIPNEVTWKKFEILKLKLRGEKDLCEYEFGNSILSSSSEKECVVSEIKDIDFNKVELPKKPSENIMSPIFSLSSKSNKKQEVCLQPTSCKGYSSVYLSPISSESLSPSHKLRLRSHSPVSKTRSCSLSPILMSESGSLSPICKSRSKSRSRSPVHSSRSYSKTQNSSQSTFSKSKSKAKKLVRCMNSNFPMDEARFQKKTISLLTCIVDLLENRVHQTNNLGTKDVEKVDNMDKFKELEESLSKEDFFSFMVGQLKMVGGKTVRENVRNVMKRLMSHTVMSCFNMFGTNRHGQKKLSFKETKICSVVVASVLSNHETTEVEILDSVKNVLKYAPEKKRDV